MASISPPEPPKRKAKPADEEQDDSTDALAELRSKLEDAQEAITDVLELIDQQEE